MAIVVLPLDLENFDTLQGFPSIASPTPVVEYVTATTSVAAFPVLSLVFPDNVLSAAYYTFSTGAIGGTPALSVNIDWFLASGAVTAGNVRFGAAVAPIGFASVTSTFPAEANIYATSLQTAVETSSALTTIANSVANVPFLTSRATIAPTVPGTFVTANGPFVVTLKVYRDGTAATDTVSGDVKVRKITVTYQDT